jgi:thiol-disulfide isomerase/thioredoxin
LGADVLFFEVAFAATEAQFFKNTMTTILTSRTKPPLRHRQRSLGPSGSAAAFLLISLLASIQKNASAFVVVTRPALLAARPQTVRRVVMAEPPPPSAAEEEVPDKNKKRPKDRWTPGPETGKFLRSITRGPQQTQRREAAKKKTSTKVDKHGVTTIETMEDYKKEVVDACNNDDWQLVCVRFFAPWCRACQATHRPFRRLAREYDNVKFVQVPLTKQNAFLHTGLGVPSLPFGHLYHPTAGLVEERRMNRKYMKEWEGLIQDYLRGSCDVPDDEENAEPLQ